MKKLISYILKGITGENIEVEEKSEGEVLHFDIKASPETIGIIIGKKGRTIRAIRNAAKVKSTLKKTPVNITVSEK